MKLTQTDTGPARDKLHELILGSVRLLHTKRYTEDIALLAKDIENAEERNSWVPIWNDAVQKGFTGSKRLMVHQEWLYVTMPLVTLKLDMHNLIHGTKAKALNGRNKGKMGSLLDQLTAELGFIKLEIPAPVLRAFKLHTVYKVSLSSPLSRQLIEQERTKEPDTGHAVAFVSTIAGLPFNNVHSLNEKHPRVYNMFTGMSSRMREHIFRNVYGVNMVEIDFTNSIVQCLAKKANCTEMVHAIEHNTLVSTQQSIRREQKEQLLRWIFSLLSEKVSTASKTKRQKRLYGFLRERITDENEVNRFIATIRKLDSPHDLFHYEDILRDFCKTHPVAINLHDAVYIPAEETELIQVLTDQLDRQGYLYQVTQH